MNSKVSISLLVAFGNDFLNGKHDIFFFGTEMFELTVDSSVSELVVPNNDLNPLVSSKSSFSDSKIVFSDSKIGGDAVLVKIFDSEPRLDRGFVWLKGLIELLSLELCKIKTFNRKWIFF